MAVDQSKIQRIVDLAKTYGATRLILFGSMAAEDGLMMLF